MRVLVFALHNRVDLHVKHANFFTSFFPFEDVGTVIDHSKINLYMFASDHPHIGGGRNPLVSFDGYLVDHRIYTNQNFSGENFRHVFGV